MAKKSDIWEGHPPTLVTTCPQCHRPLDYWLIDRASLEFTCAACGWRGREAAVWFGSVMDNRTDPPVTFPKAHKKPRGKKSP